MVSVQKFTIQGRLWSINEIIAIAQRNRFAYGKRKKDEMQKCAYDIIRQGISPITRPCQMSFKWIEPNKKRDLDNISSGGRKVILDALVTLRKIPNDTREWITGFKDDFTEVSKENPRIEVEITEIK